MGSATHVRRCQNGIDLIEQCEAALVNIGHMVFTIAPEIRMFLLDDGKMDKLQKASVALAEEYLGIGGIQSTLHYFGNLDEHNYAKYHPHFNLIFPLMSKECYRLDIYKLSVEQLREMRVKWGMAQERISGEKLSKPVRQETREKELVINYRWFTFDSIDWWGIDDKTGDKCIKNMNHLIWYDFRSTVAPENLVQQPDEIKEFVYFSMYKKHTVKGYGTLSNSLRTKTLTVLNPSYEKPTVESYRCLVDNTPLEVKKLYGSNKALISNGRQDSSVAPIKENISGLSTSLLANYNVIKVLFWRNIFIGITNKNLFMNQLVKIVGYSIDIYKLKLVSEIVGFGKNLLNPKQNILRDTG